MAIFGRALRFDSIDSILDADDAAEKVLRYAIQVLLEHTGCNVQAIAMPVGFGNGAWVHGLDPVSYAWMNEKCQSSKRDGAAKWQSVSLGGIDAKRLSHLERALCRNRPYRVLPNMWLVEAGGPAEVGAIVHPLLGPLDKVAIIPVDLEDFVSLRLEPIVSSWLLANRREQREARVRKRELVAESIWDAMMRHRPRPATDIGGLDDWLRRPR